MSPRNGIAHSRTTGRDPVSGQFKPGHKGAYRTRLALVQERIKALQDQFRADNACDLALLGLAAVHLVDSEKARSRTQRVRAANMALKILREIPRKPAPERTLDDVLAEAGA